MQMQGKYRELSDFYGHAARLCTRKQLYDRAVQILKKRIQVYSLFIMRVRLFYWNKTPPLILDFAKCP